MSTSRDATELERLADLWLGLARALESFASSLDQITSSMAVARSDAAAAGLTVTSTGIDLGSIWRAPKMALVVAGDPSGQGAATTISSAVSSARAHERGAHAALAAALGRSRDECWLEDGLETFGLALPDGAGTTEKVVWGYGLASLGVAVAADARLERLARSYTYGFEAPEIGRADDLARRAASRANLVGKVVGPVGNLLSAGMSAKSQWDADRDNEELSDADRRGRAAVRGVVEGGGAAAGAWAGGTAGATIGTFFFPGVGTVVGGAVGGAIGGVAGSKAGKWVADGAVEAVDDVIDLGAEAGEAIGDGVDAATEAVGEGLDVVAHGIDDAGDKLKDAGDKLVFWR